MRARILAALLALTLTPRPGAAQAQNNIAARDLLREATELFQNLDIDGAEASARRALRVCDRERCDAWMLARIHLMLGVLAVGGRGDQDRGAEEFAEALRLDPGIAPDPELANEEITAVFEGTRRQLQGSAAQPEPPRDDRSAGATAARRGEPCLQDEDCGTGFVCRREACEVAGSPPPVEPPVAEADMYRVALDLGVGVGAAYLSGNPTYAETGFYGRFPEPTPTCGPPRQDDPTRDQFVCATNLSPGFAAMGYLHAALRVRLDRRFAVGAAMRYQFDAAAVSPLPNDRADRAKFLFAHLLVNARGYMALSSRGFARNGFNSALFAGVGFGQIQPRPRVAGEAGPAAHVYSGLFNVHAGVRLEYGFASMLHVGVDVTAHMMFPAFLPVLDLQAGVGMHY